jgi:repressor LexA
MAGSGSNVMSAVLPGSGNTLSIPVVGRVAAGSPILADENVEKTVQVDSFLVGAKESDKVFALRVSGDSMIEAGIMDGDYIFVKKKAEARKGEIVVAMIDGEATVKRYEPDGDVIRFVPENSSMEPIVVRKSDFRDTQIIGLVCGVYRRM